MWSKTNRTCIRRTIMGDYSSKLLAVWMSYYIFLYTLSMWHTLCVLQCDIIFYVYELWIYIIYFNFYFDNITILCIWALYITHPLGSVIYEFVCTVTIFWNYILIVNMKYNVATNFIFEYFMYVRVNFTIFSGTKQNLKIFLFKQEILKTVNLQLIYIKGTCETHSMLEDFNKLIHLSVLHNC